MPTTRPALLAGLIVLLPGAAFAHTGAGGMPGAAYGFLHPLTGLDHLLAMVAVGLMAALMGGRALWLVPSIFLIAMGLGGALAMAGGELPAVEFIVALSVLVIGLVVALDVAMPLHAAVAMVATFALFHGHAHGSELPTGLSGLTYAVGFVLATAMLHATGVGLGLLAVGASGERGRRVLRFAGGGMALAGGALIASLL